MAKKRFKQLSTEEKMQLASDAGRALEEDTSLNKIARQEFRKRKKAGNLQQTLFPEQELGSDMSQPRSETVKEPITVAVGIEGAEKPFNVQKDISAESTLAQQQQLAADLQAKYQSQEDLKKKNMSFLNVFSNTAGTPTENVSNKAAVKSVITRLDGGTPEDIVDADDRSKQDIVTSTQLNEEYNKQNNNWTKTIDLSEQNPDDVVYYANKDDINNMYADLQDDLAMGDPDAQKKIDAFDRVMSGQNPNVRTYEPALEKLGLHDYYPDMGEPLAVGNYTGRIIGSNPIFVTGGQVLPMGVYDARKRALERAAKEKAMRRDKIMEMVYAKGAAQYQDQLDNMTMDLISEYGEATNWNWDEIASYSSKNAVKFWGRVREIKSLGAVTLKTQAQVDELSKKIVGEDKVYVPKSAERMMMEWNTGSMDINKLWDDKKKFNRLVNGLQAFDNMSYYAGQAAKDLAAQKDALPIDPDTGQPVQIKLKSINSFTAPELQKNLNDLASASYHNDYDMYVNALMKFVDDDRINVIAKGLYDNHKFGGSQEEVKKYLVAMIGKEIEIKNTIAKKYNVELLNLQKRRQNLAEKNSMTVWTNVNNAINDPQMRTAMFNIGSGVKSEEAKKQFFSNDLSKYIGMSHVTDENGKPSNKAIFKADASPEETAQQASVSISNAYVYDYQTKKRIKGKDWFEKNKSRKDLKDEEKNLVEYIKANGLNVAVKGSLVEKRVEIRTNDTDIKTGLPVNDRVMTTDDMGNAYSVRNAYGKGQQLYNTSYTSEQGDTKVVKHLPPMLVSYDLNNQFERSVLDANSSENQRLFKMSQEQQGEVFAFPSGETGLPSVNLDE